MATRSRAAVLCTAVVTGALAAGCGNDHFENEPRPPVTLELTGVITDDGVTVSPSKVGAGPVTLTVSNQTGRNRMIILEGDSTRAEEGPVPPGATGTIRRTLAPGSYEVRAGSRTAMRRPIAPARLEIGPERPDSNNDLQLP